MSGVNNPSAVSDEAYAADWDGVTTVAPSKNAVYDEINSLPAATAPVVKQTSEAVNNSTTLQDDDDLLFAVAANETWAFMVFAITEEVGATNARIKFAFTGPSGSTVTWGQIAPQVNQADMGNMSVLNMAGTKTGASFSSGNVNDAGTELATRILMGSIINGANAGNLQTQFAQATAQAHDTLLLAGSFMAFWKV